MKKKYIIMLEGRKSIFFFVVEGGLIINTTKTKQLIPMSFDLLFKKMFGDENHKERVSYLVSTILNIPYEEVKDNIEILPNDKKLNNKKTKRQAQDVVVRIILSVNKRISLEMNMNYNITNKNRNLMYLANMYSNQLKNKEDYNKLEPCIQVNFNTVYTDNKNKVLYDIYTLKNNYGNELTDMIKIINLNIDECHNICYNKNINEYEESLHEIIKYGALLMEKDYLKLESILEEIKMENEVKEDILDTMEEYSNDEDFSYLYYDEEHNRRAIENGTISEVREETKKETRKETKKEIAKSMKEKEMDINLISELTGLTEEEIKML